MKTIIIYGSKYGMAQKSAEILKEKIKGECDIVNIKECMPQIENYDRVIISVAVYLGDFVRKMRIYLKKNYEELMKKPFYVLVTSSTKDDLIVSDYIRWNMPIPLYKHITFKMSVGGVINFKKLSFFERKLIDYINKKNGKPEWFSNKVDKIDNFDIERINTFAKNVNK